MGLTIQDLGSIGEMIGAVAVVITLLYLGSQIRQNTIAVKAAAMQSVFEATSNVWHNSCAQFDRTEKLFEIAAKPAKERSPAERQYHLGWIMLTVRAQENMFFHLKLGTVDDEYIRLEARINSLFRHPQSIYRNAWEDGTVQPFVSEDFQSFVESVVAKTGKQLESARRT
jgi:hypothetical protein